MHFFNPATVMQFVEVIRTVVTSDDVFSDVKALAERLDKKPVVVGDKAGFIANALLFGYLNHAVSMYEQRYATREDLDAAMRFGCAAARWVRWPSWTSSVWTRHTRSSTRCITRAASACTPRARSSSRWSTRVSRAARADAGSTRMPPGSLRGRRRRQTPGWGPAEDPGLAKIAKVGVVGSGTMATGIIEVFAKAGYDVVSWRAARTRSTGCSPRSRRARPG
jgi:3-hydroxybutyryl-CoA dehydrogenase